MEIDLLKVISHQRQRWEKNSFYPKPDTAGFSSKFTIQKYHTQG